jgi:hypothetical protein
VVVVTAGLGELGAVDDAVCGDDAAEALVGAALLDAAAGAELVATGLLGAAVVVAAFVPAGDVVAGTAELDGAPVVEGIAVVDGTAVVGDTGELLISGVVCPVCDVSGNVDSGVGDCGTDVGAVDASLGVGAKVPVPDRPESEFVSDGMARVIGGMDGMVVAAGVGTSSFKDGGTVKVIPGGTVASGLRSTTLADN